MDQNNKKFKELVDARERLWEGHVKRANILALNRGYLLLDNRTIKISDARALVLVPDAKEKMFNVFRNKPVTVQEWLNETSVGCDNCGDIPQMRDAEDLEWYEDGKFFCKGCFKTQNVQNFLSVLPE
jgi:formylmethanofuran dehydrogenase subunit E